MYVELHCHSAFSFLDGASHPEELAYQAKALGYDALALTDHNGLYGSMAFAEYAKSIDLRPITGAELTLLDGAHVTVLAEAPTGYANLCRLITQAHLTSPDRHDPRLPLDALIERQDGLIVLSGCRMGLLDVERLSDLRTRAAFMLRVFGPTRFFVELQRNAVRGDMARTNRLAMVADELGLGVVATSNAHYHAPERHRLHNGGCHDQGKR